ncbi:MAG: hypothetical protein HQM15_10775 [Deltaproteobacteria bacterium]|nr:hypothetical protein [Deltaproteobacteria bacterium]
MPDLTETPDTLNPETISKLIENQKEQLSIQHKEQDFKIANDKNNFEYAKATLEAQERDNKDQRLYFLKQQNKAYLFSGFIVLSLGVCAITALYLGKEIFADKVITGAISFLAGGLSGYSYCLSKDNKTGS